MEYKNVVELYVEGIKSLELTDIKEDISGNLLVIDSGRA